jgi:hypothetical protein
VAEHFILDDTCVVEHENVFDRKGWEFGEEDSTEGIGDTGIDADKRKCGIVGFVLVEVDFQVVPEAADVPGVINARSIVAWKYNNLVCDSMTLKQCRSPGMSVDEVSSTVSGPTWTRRRASSCSSLKGAHEGIVALKGDQPDVMYF